MAQDPDFERIRRKAHELWEAEGYPHGRDMDHWNQAREIIAIEDSQASTLLPRTTGAAEPKEPRLAVDSLGDVPGLTDQGKDDLLDTTREPAVTSPGKAAAAKKPAARAPTKPAAAAPVAAPATKAPAATMAATAPAPKTVGTATAPKPASQPAVQAKPVASPAPPPGKMAPPPVKAPPAPPRKV